MATTVSGQNMAKVKMGKKVNAKATARDNKAAVTDEDGGTAKDPDRYTIEDGLRTLTRAEEVRGDKKLMSKIQEHADSQAELMQRAAGMAKRGMISERQAEKLNSGGIGSDHAQNKQEYKDDRMPNKDAANKTSDQLNTYRDIYK